MTSPGHEAILFGSREAIAERLLAVSREPSLVRGFYPTVCDGFASQPPMDPVVIADQLKAAIDAYNDRYGLFAHDLLYPNLRAFLEALITHKDVRDQVVAVMRSNGTWPQSADEGDSSDDAPADCQ